MAKRPSSSSANWPPQRYVAKLLPEPAGTDGSPLTHPVVSRGGLDPAVGHPVQDVLDGERAFPRQRVVRLCHEQQPEPAGGQPRGERLLRTGDPSRRLRRRPQWRCRFNEGEATLDLGDALLLLWPAQQVVAQPGRRERHADPRAPVLQRRSRRTPQGMHGQGALPAHLHRDRRPHLAPERVRPARERLCPPNQRFHLNGSY